MLQDSPAAKRHNRGNGTAAALMTIRAYYTPETSKKYGTKKAAASAYGVSAPLFTKWEKELQKTPAVMDQIARGEMPPDPAPQAAEVCAVEEMSVVVLPAVCRHIPTADELRNLLKSSCNRLGDNAAYGKHGTAGMYREGIKWAFIAMKSGLLAKDGRKAAALLEVF